MRLEIEVVWREPCAILSRSKRRASDNCPRRRELLLQPTMTMYAPVDTFTSSIFVLDMNSYFFHE